MPIVSDPKRPKEYYERLARRRNVEHWPDCVCNQCWTSCICCIPCHWEFRTVSALRNHNHKVHSGKLTRSERREHAAKHILIPDGLGYLQRVLASKTTADRFNLSAINRFADALAKRKFGTDRRARFTKAHRRILRDLEQAAGGNNSSNTVDSLSVPLDFDQLFAIYRTAGAAGVTPAFVASAFIAYGIEYLASELKKHPVAPNHAIKRPEPPVRKEDAHDFFADNVNKRPKNRTGESNQERDVDKQRPSTSFQNFF